MFARPRKRGLERATSAVLGKKATFAPMDREGYKDMAAEMKPYPHRQKCPV